MISMSVFILVVVLLILAAMWTVYRFSEHSFSVGYSSGKADTSHEFNKTLEFKNKIIAEQTKLLDERTTPKTSDGWHTFEELYNYRAVYNAGLVNLIVWYKKYSRNSKFDGIDVIKSKKHFGGEKCYDGQYFVVMIKTPIGQISNHYKLEYWDMFNCRVAKQGWKWDGHTMKESLERLKKLYKYIDTGRWV